MDAILLFSHGSVVGGIERNLLDMAARMRRRGDAAIVEIGFLNYTEPRFPLAIQRCIDQGATRIIVAPYFLVAGKFVVEDLPRAIESVRAQHPSIAFVVADVIGFHPALADAILTSARDANPAADTLLITAHGSPRPEANEDIRRVVELIRDYAIVKIGYLDCNQPDIPAAIDECVAAGAKSIAAVPYFLHSGKHFQRDVPELLEAGARKHGVLIRFGDYVGHLPQIDDVLRDRVRAVTS
ncbi:MAG TPA: sirohydrochlorin chelatase [Thermoanaerobaculia bacterium]|nr:sirohydrochlorin chelatase [Thermoanaerobaculia bacterium]